MCAAKGFARCPPEIHRYIVEWLYKLIVDVKPTHVAIRNILYASSENVALVKEILRQSFSMPLSSANTMKLTLAAYQTWLKVCVTALTVSL